MERRESSVQGVGEDARALNGTHELQVLKTEAVEGRWIRYTVVDAQGDQHCVGVPARGFFTTGELESMSRSLTQITEGAAQAADVDS